MSKLYFAKYLQIEGIPTFGDKYKHPLSDDIFTNTNNTSVDIDYSECKKVKLFLCSRDTNLSLPYPISEKAVFVKENDEFQGEGIDFVIAVSDEDYEKPAIEQNPFYIIKCPCCGDFK